MISRLLLFSLCFLLFAGIAQGYEIEDDCVVEDAAQYYLRVCPHTVTMPGEEVYFQLQSKNADADIDVMFGFDTDEVRPARGKFYRNGSWNDVGGKFGSVERDYHGFDKWYYYRNFSVEAGKSYYLKAQLDIGEERSGKYFFAFKLSSDTLEEAMNSGRFFAMDPWWDLSYIYRYAVNASCSACTTNTSGYVPVNNSFGVYGPVFDYIQHPWCNFSIVPNGTVPLQLGWYYFNNQSDGLCLDMSDTRVPHDQTEFNGSRFLLPHDDLLLWLHLGNTTAGDTSMYNNTMVGAGGSPVSWPAMKGRGIYFRDSGGETGEYLNYSTITHFNNMTNITIMAWFNLSAPLDSGDIVATHAGDSLSGFSFSYQAGALYFCAKTEAAWNCGGGGSVTNDIWYHGAATYDNETFRIYLNGVEVATSAVPTGEIWNNVTRGVIVGKNNNIPDPTYLDFFGVVDEIMIFNTTLAPDDIMAYYELMNGSAAAPVGPFESAYINITSPVNATYISGDIGIPLTWHYLYTPADCNWSAYSLNGAANVTTDCENITFVPDGGANTLIFYANSTEGNMMSDTVSFSYRFAEYNIHFVDEMTNLPYSITNGSITVFCTNETANQTVSGVAYNNFTIDCEFDEIRLTVNDYNEFWRYLIPTIFTGNITFYVYNESEETDIGQIWEIGDQIGEYPEGIVQMTKVYGDIGEIIISEKIIDAENKVVHYMVVGEKYCFSVFNSDKEEERSLGCMDADTDASKSVQVSNIPFRPEQFHTFEDIVISYAWNSTSQIIQVIYNDTLDETTSATVTIYNATNISEVLYTDTIVPTDGIATFTYNGVDINETHIVNVEASHTRFGQITDQRQISFESRFKPNGLEGLGLGIFMAQAASILTISVMLAFGRKFVNIGLAASIIMTIMFMYWGWFDSAPHLGWAFLAVIMFIVVLNNLGRRKK